MRKDMTRRNHSLQDHLEGAVVKGVSPNDPHELPVQDGLVGSTAHRGAEGLHVGQNPVRLRGGDVQRTIWTCFVNKDAICTIC